MAQSKSFSIFLLKDGFNAKNSLKKKHALGDSITNVTKLPKGATLYILDKAPSPPWWKDYWGIQQNLKQSLKGAIVFLPVGKRCFAITFGHTYHNLDETSYEYDFGLRTTLNALDPNKIKSSDILQPENARRERIQCPIASDLTFFDFNRDESIVKKLTGAVKTEYKDILTSITGASSLKVSSKATASEISALCKKLLDVYKKEDFKKSFPDIQNIVPVKEPILLQQLNEKLIKEFNNESVNLVLAIPEIIDYAEAMQIKYSGARSDKSVYDDVCIANYREYLQNKNVKKITLNTFIAHKMNMQDENGSIKHSFSIFKCLLFDCELDSEHYHLCDGEWYKIDKDYIAKLKAELDPIFDDYDVLDECNDRREDDYNCSVVKSNPQFICLDKKNIAPKGQHQIEPCDLLTTENNTAELIHIKISTRSSSLSHLFNQGVNSVDILRENHESMQKLRKLLPDSMDLTPIDNDKFAVIYGIITGKDKNKKSDNLPIFSRISLKRARRGLDVRGIKCSVVLIKDNVDRKTKSS